MANDFSGTAELARKRYELAKGMAESKREQRLGGIGATYAQRAREQEAGLESRGILSSGEASRRRMQLGAEEKALRAGAQSEAEFDINQAALDYAAVLAEIQAQQSTGLGGSGGSTTTPSIQTPTPPTPSLPPATKPIGPSDETPKVPVPVPGSTVGLPTVRPGQGGINEIGSGGRPFGEAPVAFNTGDFVGGPDRKLGAGAVVDGIYLGPELGGFFGDTSAMPKAQPGQGGITEIGSGGREIGVAPQASPVEPKPVGSGQIELAGVTLPATQWQKTLDALQEAQKTPALPVTRPLQGGITEIGSAGREIGAFPLPSVVAPVVAPAQTPAPALPVTRPLQGGITEIGSAGREIGTAPTKGKLVTIGDVTLPQTEWDAAFKALEKAALAKRPTVVKR